MTTNTRDVKSFDIEKIEVDCYTGRNFDLMNMWTQIDLYEDLFSNVLTAQVKIRDHQNLIMNGPFCGRETITITYKTPGKGSVTKKFRVYKVGPRTPQANETTVQYTLSMVSEEFITSQQTKISQFYEGKIDEIVNKIHSDHLGSSTPLKAEKCLHKQKFIIPYWTPLNSINWLAARAVDSKNPENCNWLFYEDLDGFKFTSWGKLASEEATSAPDSLLESIGRAIIDILPNTPSNSTFSDFTYFPSPTETDSDGEDKEIAFKNMERLLFPSSHNVMENIESGYFASHLVTHDIVRKKYEHSKYSYKNDFDSADRVEKESMLAQKGDDFSDKEWSHYKYYPKHKLAFDKQDDNDKVETWVLKRNAQMQQMEGQRLNFTAPGDSTRRVGQVVDITMPTFATPSKPLENWYDKYITGKYVISAIRHSISNENYEMRVELIRDSLPNPMPSSATNFNFGSMVDSAADFFRRLVQIP